MLEECVADSPLSEAVMSSTSSALLIERVGRVAATTRKTSGQNKLEENKATNRSGSSKQEFSPGAQDKQYYRAIHAGFDRTGAPISAAQGKLAAVVGIVSLDPAFGGAQAPTSAAIASAVRAIEERAFRELFAREWIVSIASPADNANALFALDAAQRIVGADRIARSILASAGLKTVEGVGLWAVFEPHASLFGDRQSEVVIRLTLAGTPKSVAAVVTPPRGAFRAEAASLPPRSNGPNSAEPAALARGGIPPRALRRVREFIDAHLEESIGLKDLAAVAGLSMFHFARAFKQSQGVTPNCYLFQRRVERAKELLAESTLSLSEIAIATGFSDQSHFARRFREHVGTTPGKFRWSTQ